MTEHARVTLCFSSSVLPLSEVELRICCSHLHSFVFPLSGSRVRTNSYEIYSLCKLFSAQFFQLSETPRLVCTKVQNEEKTMLFTWGWQTVEADWEPVKRRPQTHLHTSCKALISFSLNSILFQTPNIKLHFDRCKPKCAETVFREGFFFFFISIPCSYANHNPLNEGHSLHFQCLRNACLFYSCSYCESQWIRASAK